MLITTRFVRDAYARLGDLPAEERLEREPDAPVFLHLVPAYHEPEIAVTVGALTASRYPHGAAARGGDHQGGGGARPRIPSWG